MGRWEDVVNADADADIDSDARADYLMMGIRD